MSEDDDWYVYASRDDFYRREAEFFRACFHHCRIPPHLGLQRFHPQLFGKAVH